MTLPHDDRIVCGYWFINTGTKEKLIEACRWHDDAYTEGSFHQKKLTRSFVDKWFLDQMLLIAKDDISRQVRAYAFYGISRIFGGLFWEGK